MKKDVKMVAMFKDDWKYVRSKKYNYSFNYKTGYFVRWGETKEQDPDVAPFSEILDLEITTKCSGPGGVPCKFCYKSNTPNGKNMSFDTFKKIIDKMKPSKDCIGIGQIALGLDSSCTSNPDTFRIMKYARDNRIVPNLTVADISQDTADKIIDVAGACAVSRYFDKNYCYDSIQRLTNSLLNQIILVKNKDNKKECDIIIKSKTYRTINEDDYEQMTVQEFIDYHSMSNEEENEFCKSLFAINIHQMISDETLEQAKETIKDAKSDPRLAKLNAIVFLSLKQKGRGTSYTPLAQEQFKDLVDYAFENEVRFRFGFDSCGAMSFIEAIQDRPDKKILEMLAEPCESTLFSSYIDVDAKFFPCSFCENVEGWEEGISVLEYEKFDDVWNHERVNEFRKKLLGCNRNCPIYKIRK